LTSDDNLEHNVSVGARFLGVSINSWILDNARRFLDNVGKISKA
jgi:hypothetical protein